MLEIDKIKSDYDTFKARYSDLVQEIKFSLEKILKEKNVKIHGVSHRVKDLESLIKKCEDKEIYNPFTEIKDIAGIRIVCLFRSDLSKIEDIIKSSFELVDIDNKIEEADGFGYMSIHYICKIGKHYQGPRYDHINNIPFEIQTRTLCMDAWAAVSHHLSYKGDWDVPDDLKRAMNALSGLFYVADNEFLHVYNESIKSKTSAQDLLEHSPKKKIPINFDTLLAYMKENLSDRRTSTDEHISKLVNQIKNSGYETIEDIDEDFSNAKDLFEEHEQNLLSTKRLSTRFTSLGATRVALAIANQKMESFRSRSNSRQGYSLDMKPYRERYLSKHKDRSIDRPA